MCVFMYCYVFILSTYLCIYVNTYLCKWYSFYKNSYSEFHTEFDSDKLVSEDSS